MILSEAPLLRFRASIEERLGLRFDDTKQRLLEDVLRRRTATRGGGTDAYLQALETQSDPEEIAALARELTVPETYFFRNADQLRAFVELALPEGASVLCAGCASGEEAYSLAILLAECVPPRTLKITALDLNPEVIAKAKRARYSAWALRETPPATRERWFTRVGNEFVLDESIRDAVRFEQRNLMDEDARLWAPRCHDVIFCRNVIMYFAPEKAARLVARIARSLVPGGHLFLGHAETLRALSNDFELQHTHGTFYYRRKDGRLDASREHAPAPYDASTEVLALAVTEGDSWVSSIRDASRRIQALSESQPRRQEDASGELDLLPVRELLAREQYADALELVARLPARSTRDPDALLLHAVLLVHRGELELAERVCERLLELDGSSAGAHYLLALCREAAGDPAGAVDYDQRAVHLDPSFAMARLHLGLLARRSGDAASSRRELDEALRLLEREDASRLLLFGGGFGRAALLALCRAELALNEVR